MTALSLLSVVLACFTTTTSFLLQSISQRTRYNRLCGLIEADFDFSSPRAWDAYYRDREDSNKTLEWHASVPFSVQLQLIPYGSSCLVVGCGSSAFPRALHDAHQGQTRVTCLDSSSACLDQLRDMHGDSCTNMTYICGDAVRLQQTLYQNDAFPRNFDVIFDKGLTDALLCNEGWDGPLKRLMTEACAVLTKGGIYVLICYRLSNSRKEFLQQVGKDVGLLWSFDIDGTNERVSVSTATRV